MERHGTPISEYPLSAESNLNLGITYSDAYREIEACVAAGLDYSKWLNREYSIEVMANVMTWHTMKGLIDAHIENEKSRAIKKSSKKGKKT